MLHTCCKMPLKYLTNTPSTKTSPPAYIPHVPLCAYNHSHVQQAPQDRARGTSGNFSSSAFSRDISSSDGSSGADMPSKKLSSWPRSGDRRYEGGGRRATERIDSNLASQSEICRPSAARTVSPLNHKHLPGLATLL